MPDTLPTTPRIYPPIGPDNLEIVCLGPIGAEGITRAKTADGREVELDRRVRPISGRRPGAWLLVRVLRRRNEGLLCKPDWPFFPALERTGPEYVLLTGPTEVAVRKVRDLYAEWQSRDYKFGLKAAVA